MRATPSGEELLTDNHAASHTHTHTHSPFTSNIYARAAAASKKDDEIAKLQAVDGPAHRTRASTGTPVGGSSSNGAGSAPGTPSKRSTRSRKN